ncbi:trypsin-like peptidase domain-containing protein [Streptomyces sp. NPDC057496]|uniref:nSTAND1 domain-containing NTPase n=1 Tax=Streptomyces sp. NPDC057496 TaxID=3346149 RepID=UPI0036BB4013
MTDESAFAGAVFQVLRDDGWVAGAGFLVREDTAVTCAHVVRAAGQGPGGMVEVAFPKLPGTPRAWARAEPEGWREPETRDVAVLRLDAAPGGTAPLPVGAAAGCRGHRVASYGFPVHAPDGGHLGFGTVAGTLADPDGSGAGTGDQVQLVEANDLTTGFSGGPVLDTVSGLVIGMVTAITSPDEHSKGLGIAYATPAEVLREALPLPVVPSPCPYMGLEPFTARQAQWFHGREDAVEKVVAALRGNRRLLMLLGPSGAGKSSLVSAGVMPALAEGAGPGSDRWLMLQSRPGRDPLAELEAAGLPGASGSGLAAAAGARLAAEPDRDHLLLVVDQFEELLTQASPRDAQRAVAQLMELIGSSVAVTVLLVMRNDFYAQLQGIAPELLDAALPGMCHVPGTLGARQLHAIVTRPAEAVGISFEAGLAERIVGEVESADPVTGRAPAALLPALELTLSQLWTRRRPEDGRLTHAAYEAIDGVTGAMTTWCNRALAQLPEGQRDTARRILTSLARPADEEAGTPATRRLVPRARLGELAADPGTEDSDGAFGTVLDALARSRIIAINASPHPDAPQPGTPHPEATVELIHDALLRDWADLRTWVAQDQEFLRWYDRADEQRTQHARTGDPDDLLSGTLLTEGEEWADRRSLPAEMGDFLRAGRRHRRAALRRTRRLNVILASLLALALIATGVAVALRNSANAASLEAQSREHEAQSRELAAQSINLADTNADVASLLAIKAWRTNPTVEAATALYAAPLEPLRGSVEGQGDKLTGVAAFSANGKHFATMASDAPVRVWDVESGKSGPVMKDSDGLASSVAFSGDGARLVIGGVDGSVRLWDARSGEPGLSLKDHGHEVTSVAFSKDGTRLASGSDDGVVRMWDVRAEEPKLIFERRGASVQAVALSRDGRRLATGDDDGFVRAWDVESGNSLLSVNGKKGFLISVAFSGDGLRLAGSFEKDVVRVWDLGVEEPELILERRGDSAGAVALNRDGTYLAVLQEVGDLTELWNVGSKKPGPARWSGGANGSAVEFVGRDEALAVGGLQGAVRLWDMGSGISGPLLKGRGSVVNSMAFSRDGGRLAASSDDGRVRVWDMRSGKPEARWKPTSESVNSVAFSGDGKYLATGSDDGRVEVWDMRSGKLEARWKPTSESVNSVAFSGDGKYLAAGSAYGRVWVWDMRSGKPGLSPLKSEDGPLWRVALNKDGKRLAVVTSNGSLRVWNTETRTSKDWVTEHGKTAGSVAFSGDGKYLAIGDIDGIVWLQDARTGKDVRSWASREGTVSELQFSGDGKYLAVGSAGSGDVRLWDVASGAVGPPLKSSDGYLQAMAFSRDGKRVATAGEHGTVGMWKVNPRSPEQISESICAALHRNFTDRETARYLRGENSEPVCPGASKGSEG